MADDLDNSSSNHEEPSGGSGYRPLKYLDESLFPNNDGDFAPSFMQPHGPASRLHTRRKPLQRYCSHQSNFHAQPQRQIHLHGKTRFRLGGTWTTTGYGPARPLWFLVVLSQIPGQAEPIRRHLDLQLQLQLHKTLGKTKHRRAYTVLVSLISLGSRNLQYMFSSVSQAVRWLKKPS